jgi:hypothetical protein
MTHRPTATPSKTARAGGLRGPAAAPLVSLSPRVGAVRAGPPECGDVRRTHARGEARPAAIGIACPRGAAPAPGARGSRRRATRTAGAQSP